MGRKGQLSVEFIFVIGAIFALFLVIMAFSFERLGQVNRIGDEGRLIDECLKFSNAIIAAALIGDNGKVEIRTYNSVNIYDYGVISIDDGKRIVECNYLGRIERETTTGLSNAIVFTNVEGEVISEQWSD